MWLILLLCIHFCVVYMLWVALWYVRVYACILFYMFQVHIFDAL